MTFRRQKKRDNGVVVTQHRTDKTGDAEMCPVRALAALVIRIWGYASVRTQGTKNAGINALASDWREYRQNRCLSNYEMQRRQSGKGDWGSQ